MRLRTSVTFGLALMLAAALYGRPAARTAAAAAAPTAAPAVEAMGVVPGAVPGAAFESIGTMAFAPDGVLFAADTQAAAIYALDLGAAASSGTPGAKDVPAIDQKIAALLGTDAASITVGDMAVHPKTHHVYFSVTRAQGAGAAPALVRLDGAGTLAVVPFDSVKSAKATLPNAPVATPGERRNPRAQSITDMAFVGGKLYVAGLSNEEFASKLRAVPYPFSSVEAGTSVEIYHGSHGAIETRSPVYAFVPYDVAGTPHIIAGYLCTPLVKFPVSSLMQGGKVRGTTIAELGAGNRPIDMIVYTQGGQDYLLMSNTNRGVMKIPTANFATAAGIEALVQGKAGIDYETIASLKGIEQLDRLDERRAIVLAREAGAGSALNLQAVPLP